MVNCQITFLNVLAPLQMWYNFLWQTDKMSVDETDTILLMENIIANTLTTKVNFTAKLHTNGQR